MTSQIVEGYINEYVICFVSNVWSATDRFDCIGEFNGDAAGIPRRSSSLTSIQTGPIDDSGFVVPR